MGNSDKLIEWGIKDASDDRVVMVIEKNTNTLTASVTNSVVLEGVFAELGVKNNNGRIYEEAQYLPQIEMLQEKISKKRLLGELDHPQSFETSLKNVSHVVESLYYDKKNRQVKGSIKLLNTECGKIAQALVEAGVPVSISSRAAGVVNERTNIVEIKKLFTFDLVCDPGFENAQLSQVHESLLVENINLDDYKNADGSIRFSSPTNNSINEKFGINDEDILIYNINESDLIKVLEDDSNIYNNKKNTNSTMKHDEINKDFVTAESMNTYSEHVKEQFTKLFSLVEGITKRVDENSNAEMLESISNLKAYTNHLAEAINETRAEVGTGKEYSKYLAETLNKAISYTEYVAETLDNSIEYTQYIAENLDNSIEYTQYIAENLDKSIVYTEYIAENLDKSIEYQEYIVENLDRTVEYTEYLAENLDTNMDKTVKLFESNGMETPFQLLTEMEDMSDDDDDDDEDLDEKKKVKKVKEGEEEDVEDDDEEIEEMKKDKKMEKVKENRSFLDSINDLLLEAKNRNAKEYNLNTKYPFLADLNESKTDEFLKLEDTEKQIVSEALNNKSYKDSNELVRIWENALQPNENWVEHMPTAYKAKWEMLAESEKNVIKNQAKTYKLNTQQEIEFFWSTRRLDETRDFKTLSELNGVHNHNRLFESEESNGDTGLGYSLDHIDKQLGIK